MNIESWERKVNKICDGYGRDTDKYVPAYFDDDTGSLVCLEGVAHGTWSDGLLRNEATELRRRLIAAGIPARVSNKGYDRKDGRPGFAVICPRPKS